MWKKASAAVIALLMALPLLTACSTSQPDNGATSAALAPTVKASATVTTQPEPTKNPNLCPYEGETITWDVFASDQAVTESIDSPVYKIYKEAVGNIELNWEISTDFDTAANIRLSAGDIPDLFWYKAATISNGYSDSGLFLDFNQYADVMPNWTALTEAHPALLTYETEDGKQFFIHDILNDYPGESWFANKSLLDELGIAIPTTLDELEAAMEQIHEADTTVTPFHTIWNLDYYKTIFSQALNAKTSFYYDAEAETWKHPITSPESNYKELVALLADYYAKGYINTEFSTMSRDQTVQLITSGDWQWGFTFMYINTMNTYYTTLQESSANPVEVVAMLPVSAEGVKPNINCAYISDQPTWAYCANINIENPELAASFLDTLLGDTVADAFQWGVEGVSYTVDANTGEKTWIQEFIDKGADAKKELGIWNILAPRYVTKRDDRSLLKTYTEFAAGSITLLVDALEAGTIESYYPRMSPQFTPDDKDEISGIMTTVNALISESEAKFVLGQRPMSEWDNFITEVTAAGDIDRAIEIYNNAKQNPDRLTSAQRDYIKP